MQEYKSANNRIIKNTSLLYVRMLISTVISLYTSRLVLTVLGVEDYGLYNVIAGFVTLLAFVNGSMVSATRRFLTIAIAEGDIKKRQLMFSMSFYIHAAIALLVTLLSFSIGYYFLEYKMTIPEGRNAIAYYVFLSSLLSILALCLTVPHNALVVAYEKMGTFALLSLIEVFLKLAIVVAIAYTSMDHLLLYAILMSLVSILVRALYVVYCHLKFEDVSYHFSGNISLVKEMLSFAGWNVFSSMAVSVYQHGINLLLNIFFGPVVNAARGISVQVQGTVKMLAVNFQQAVGPQITKSYAISDFYRLQQLVFMSVKCSYFLIFLISCPILFETDYILKIWLGQVPEYTADFVRLSMGVVLLDVVTEPFTTAVLAKGAIRKYQFVTGTIQVMILPLSYFVLKAGASPISVYVVNLLIILVLDWYRIHAASLLLNINKKGFICSVLSPVFVVTVCSCIFSYFLILYVVNETEAVVRILLCVCIPLLFIGLWGLGRQEKRYIINLIFKRR